MIPRLSTPSSRATDAPSFRVLSDGRAIPASYSVASIVVEEQVFRLASAEILMYDGDPASGNFPASNASEFEPGSTIRIEMGYHQENETVFEGIVVRQRIQVIGDQSFFRVECKDKAYRLTQGRKSRYFYEEKDSDILQSMLSSQGLSGQVDSTQVVHPVMIQYHCSDWDFLLSRADANGLLVLVRLGKVDIKAPDFSQAPALSLQYGSTILELEADLDGRHQQRQVEATAWDAANQDMIQYAAQNPSVVSPGNLRSTDLADAVGLETKHLLHGGQLSGQELQVWAGSEQLRSQLSKMRGRVRIQGVGEVTIGDMIDLGGLGDRFSGKAFVSAVRQELNGTNWETDISFGMSQESYARQFDDIPTLPAEGLLPAMPGLHIAVVTKLGGDPAGEDRITVRIPGIDTQGEGSWARLATLDAGQERGTFFRPEIGDEVVVGFLHDDPRHPIVLGQLHSSNKPAPSPAQDDNHEKGYISRGKIRLIFDDEKKSLTLETPKQKQFILDDQAGEIKIADEYGNKIILGQGGITIESASKLTLKAVQSAVLEGGTSTDVKATGQVTVSGQAGAELSASGNTVVKGAIVQIN